MKIRTEFEHTNAGVLLKSLDQGDMFSLRDPKDSYDKMVVLRKTAKFGGIPGPGKGQTMICLSLEYTGEFRDGSEGEGHGEIVEHRFVMFQGVDLDRTVFRLGKVKALNIKLEME